MTDRLIDKYGETKTRLALQYQKANIPEDYWFADFKVNESKLLVCAESLVVKKKRQILFSTQPEKLLKFTVELVKQVPQLRPKMIDYATLAIRLQSQYTRFEAMKEDTGRLAAVWGIRRSKTYDECVGDLLLYLEHALANNSRLILGFVVKDIEQGFTDTFGGDMAQFLSTPSFNFTKIT